MGEKWVLADIMQWLIMGENRVLARQNSSKNEF